jgi:hypothetical protein
VPLGSPIVSSLKITPRDLVSEGDGNECLGRKIVPDKNDYLDPNHDFSWEVTIVYIVLHVKT